MRDGTVNTLRLVLADGGPALDFEVKQLIVAGFTGRDEEKVAEHVEELRQMGVPAPDRTPTFYRLPADLVTQDHTITVRTATTSGEVEPVLLCQDGSLYIGLGSDHTDRQLEQQSIKASKAACPKPIATGVLPYTAQVARWDSMQLRSFAGGGEVYQHGHLADILSIERVLELFRSSGGEMTPGTVVFLGTIPLRTGAFDYSTVFRGELVAGEKTLLSFDYKIEVEGG